MKGKLRLALGGLIIMFLLLGASPALADGPTLPHAFYGTVAIGDHDAPVDSVVSAEVGGLDCGSYTIGVAGHYGNLDERDYLIVQGDISNGDSITFYVNGVVADTFTFEAGGGPTQLNLTVPETPPTVDTSAASSVTTSRATLKGNLDNLGTALLAVVSFEWGRTTAYGRETTVQPMTSTGPFSFSLSGLSDDTTYHFRAKAVGDGPSYGTDRTFTTRAVAPEAVGVGAPAPPAGTTDVSGKVTAAGRFTRSVTATSEDELCTLTIPRDTVGLTEELEPLDEIAMVIMDDPPPPAEDASIVGLAYDFGPDGATFDPPITLEYTYDPDDIPEGVDEEDLVIARWDEEAGEWVELPCTVDPATHTITASVSHFTTFAIIARRPVPPPPAPAPAPAAFSLSNLTVQPIEVQPNESVTITVSVANTGGTEGSYSVVLMINGVKEAEKRVTVAAADSQLVSFCVSKEEAGSYTVVVDGLRASFTVVAPPPPAPPPPPPAPPPVKPPFNWVLVGIMAGVVVLTVLVFFFVIRPILKGSKSR